MTKLNQKEDLDSKSLWLGKLFSSFESIFSSEKKYYKYHEGLLWDHMKLCAWNFFEDCKALQKLRTLSFNKHLLSAYCEL